MIIPKFISRSFQPTVQNGRGWLRNFKRTMSGAKNEQSIKFDPLQGATKSTKAVGPSPVEIPLVSVFPLRRGDMIFNILTILF